MAGSYSHVTNDDGTFRGVELLDDLGDALEALEECHWLIRKLTNGADKAAVMLILAEFYEEERAKWKF